MKEIKEERNVGVRGRGMKEAIEESCDGKNG